MSLVFFFLGCLTGYILAMNRCGEDWWRHRSKRRPPETFAEAERKIRERLEEIGRLR